MTRSNDWDWDWDGLIVSALEAGVDLDEFWRRTPAELGFIFEAFNKNIERESNLALLNTWMSAALQRTKRMPLLKDLIKEPKKTKRQTWKDQLAFVKMLNAAFGGSDKSDTNTNHKKG